MSKRECTEAERRLIEDIVEYHGQREGILTGPGVVSLKAVLAERQPKDPRDTFIANVRSMHEVAMATPDRLKAVFVDEVEAEFTKLDAARKEKP